jgi:hypothetical protein
LFWLFIFSQAEYQPIASPGSGDFDEGGGFDESDGGGDFDDMAIIASEGTPNSYDAGTV